MKFPGCRTGTLISLFHLPHFFRRFDSAEDINIRKIFAHICNSPLKAVDFYGLQHIFGKFLMRTLREEYKEFIEVDVRSYQTPRFLPYLEINYNSSTRINEYDMAVCRKKSMQLSIRTSSCMSRKILKGMQ
jgi:hypothetical protein